MISEQWPTQHLSEVAEIISGQSPKGEFYNDSGEGLPFYQGKKEFQEKYIGSPTKWTSKTTKLAYEGDILMSVRAPVGPINFATQEICIGRGLAAIRVSEQMNRHFLFYQLLFKQDEISGKDGAVFPSINKGMIGEIQVVVPPLQEQKRIVNILDEALLNIASLIVNVQTMSHSAKELIETKLHTVFHKDSSEWEKIPFEKSIVKVKATTKIKRSEFKESGLYPIISQEKDFINGYWNSADDLLKIQTPVVGFGDHTKTLKYIEFDFVRGADGLKILQPIESIFPKFFYHQLRSMKLETLGYARHYRLLKQVDIRVTSIEHQHKIASMFDELDEQVSQIEGLYEIKLQSLEELKQSILKEAFNGKLTGGNQHD
jgi:type I restriction enzyme, S subunit